MFLMHPVCLALSLIGALAYAIRLSGRRAVRLSLYGLLPFLVFTAVLNPVFNHEGATILTYLPDGNPLTLEAILYGIAAATMMVTVILWFSCYSRVMTSDKFIFLFGRVIPALSLIFSMILRFVLSFFDTVQNCCGCAALHRTRTFFPQFDPAHERWNCNSIGDAYLGVGAGGDNGRQYEKPWLWFTGAYGLFHLPV